MILGGFGVVWGGILGAKRRPKLLQNLMQKMIDFWIAPKTVLGGFGTRKEVPGGRDQFDQNPGEGPFIADTTYLI